MIPLLPQILVLGAAGALLAGFAGGWAVCDAFADADALRAANRLIEAKDETARIVARHAGDFEAFRQSVEQQRPANRTIIEKEYRDVPVPADCALRPDALGVLEDARQRANAAASGQSGEPLPDDTADPRDRP